MWVGVPGGHTVALEEFVAHVAPPAQYPSLEVLAAELAAHPGDGRVVAELARELARDGTFRRPLRVEDGSLANGCHRFAAAWEARVDRVGVWVVLGDGPAEPAPHSSDVLEVSFTVAGLPDGLAGDDVEDLLFSVGRSFPVGDHQWAEADVASCVGGVWSFPFFDDGFDPEVLGGLLTARLAAHGMAIEVCSVERSEGD